ncbi:uncharacterized protein L203_102433 [Cryptococcus depauperatus CBS 7841]|uniref:Importin N-terminal domain-containing protein n=1 Tax=Cryptococcus depauperatus CBS 7841 TaxID=1295531 RepID=A0AAJ8M139_9TREE
MSTQPRNLLYAVAHPANHETYAQDQMVLSNRFKEPEFLVELQALSADRSLSHQERLMASLITGREMRSKWRSKAQRLFEFLNEDELSIARPQLGLFVAVARIEYPKTWQNLPDLLLSSLVSSLTQLKNLPVASSTISTLLVNTLWTINALVKDWKMMRLAQGTVAMQTFEQIFSEPVREILEIWAKKEQEGGGDPTLEEAGRYAFKILARFCQWHWSKAKPMQTYEFIQRIERLVQHTVHYSPIVQSNRLRLITSGSASDKVLKSMTKHLRAIGKWWRVMLSLDPKRFCQFDGITTGIGWWWGEVGRVVAETNGAIVNDVFTSDFILSAFHLLVDKFLPLNSSDLEALEDEPEEWLIGESMDEEAWAFELRPCAERVLIALNNACRNISRENKVIEPAMLKLLSEIDYINQMLTEMSSWINQGQPLHRIVKRRVAWFIGEWVSGDEESAKLPVVWQMLLYLLSERGDSSDKAVNITAAVAIKECIDLWELPIDYFLPFVGQIITEFTLTGKRYVNDSIGVVIERVGNKVLPFLPDLAQSVPNLWSGATGLEGEWLFKASLVVLVTKVVATAKESSDSLMELVVPLIEESLKPPAKEFFEEDGLILWQTALQNSVSPYHPSKETGLIKLFPNLLVTLGENMDLLQKFLALLNSYLLLDAPGLTQIYGEMIAAALAKALAASRINTPAIGHILVTISLWIRTSPLPALSPHLLRAGIFHHITGALEDDKASGPILAAYLEILVRIAMTDPAIFLQMIQESAKLQNKNSCKLLEEALDAIWRNFDYVGDTRMRKAVAMGVGNLLLTGNQQALERFDGEFMNIFLDVLGEVQPLGDSFENKESGLMPWSDEHRLQWADIQNAPEGHRRTRLEDSDPAFAVPLRTFIIQILNQAMQFGLGPYWDKANEDTKRSLENIMNNNISWDTPVTDILCRTMCMRSCPE